MEGVWDLDTPDDVLSSVEISETFEVLPRSDEATYLLFARTNATAAVQIIVHLLLTPLQWKGLLSLIPAITSMIESAVDGTVKMTPSPVRAGVLLIADFKAGALALKTTRTTDGVENSLIMTVQEWTTLTGKAALITHLLSELTPDVVIPDSPESPLPAGYMRSYTWCLTDSYLEPEYRSDTKLKSDHVFYDLAECQIDAYDEMVRQRVMSAEELALTIQHNDFKTPTRGQIIKAAILFYVHMQIKVASKLHECIGCTHASGAQKNHMGAYGCLENDATALSRMDVKLYCPTVANMYSLVLKRLSMPYDPFALMAVTFASEVFDDYSFEIDSRPTLYDQIFKEYMYLNRSA